MGSLNRRGVISLVRATTRALKAVGYYDPGHPILQQLQRELHGYLKEACQGQPALILASAGAKLLVSESEPPLTDGSATVLASHLFSRSIVALKLTPSTGVRDLGALLQALSETPEKVRLAGGLTPLLQRQGASGIEVFEVDFAELFAGKKTEIAARDPLVQKALGELLQFKEKKDRTGTALGISLDNVSSPDSLGAFLDELLEKAAPGVASVGAPVRGGRDGASSAGRGSGPGGGGTALRGTRGSGSVGTAAIAGLSGDELAELASEAFVGACEKMTSQGVPENTLNEAGKVLSSALVRLSPEARFSLLRQLAGTEGKRGGSRAATSSLSTQLKDELIVGAISSVLNGQQGDPETISVIGSLIRQLRPIESERRKLLDSLDQTLRSEGQPINGMLWQELQANALGSDGFGMLEISFRQTVGPLAERARARLAQKSQSPEVQQVVAATTPEHHAAHAAKLLIELLPHQGDVDPALASMAKELIEGMGAGGDVATPEQLKLLAVLLKRAEGQRSSSPVAKILKELLSGLKGIPRAIALLKSQLGKGSSVLAEALLEALDASGTIDAKKELVAAFSSMDESMLKVVRAKVIDGKPFGTYQTLLLTLRSNPAAGLELARQALRNRAVKSKESVLRALASLAEPGSVALLARAAGCEGDEESLKALVLQEPKNPEAETTLRSLQRAAIEALGEMRSELAVPQLELVLNRRKMVGNSLFDSLRPSAAKALVANSTPGARRVLEAGRASKHGAIREACSKAG